MSTICISGQYNASREDYKCKCKDITTTGSGYKWCRDCRHKHARELRDGPQGIYLYTSSRMPRTFRN